MDDIVPMVDALKQHQTQIGISNSVGSVFNARNINRILNHLDAFTNLLCNHNVCQKAVTSYIIKQQIDQAISRKPDPLECLLDAVGFNIQAAAEVVSRLHDCSIDN